MLNNKITASQPVYFRDISGNQMAALLHSRIASMGKLKREKFYKSVLTIALKQVLITFKKR